MSILSFFRRTKSRFADDKAVGDFERVLRRDALPPKSAFGAAMEDDERDRQAYFDLIENIAGKKPPDI